MEGGVGNKRVEGGGKKVAGGGGRSSRGRRMKGLALTWFLHTYVSVLEGVDSPCLRSG